MRLKTKLILGTWFLFLIILVFGVLSMYTIHTIRTDAGNVLRNDHESAVTWLTIIFSALILIAFTLAVNFPSLIGEPIRAFTEGIKAIANKNYDKRIHLKRQDEFGELAEAFNSMAEKLDEYESSNLAQIKFEKSRIETIINRMSDGVIGLDINKNILFINAVAQNLLGVKETQVLGRYAVDLALTNDLMRTLLQEDASNKELKIYADNKESYFTKEWLDVVTKNNETIGQVIVLRNVTIFHELNDAKTNFIATVSHELKTPIAAIKMSTSLLKNDQVGKLNGEQNELVKSIVDDADRLLKITSELLNMAQIESGNLQLNPQPVSAEEIVNLSLEPVQALAAQKNISIHTQISTNIPSFTADLIRTSWVLVNFLTNAVRYSSSNSEIQVEVSANDNGIEFIVTDHGTGIEEKYLHRIFDRYFKVPGSSSTEGTGLGLAISKAVIEAQRGKIWVKSEWGRGSSFGFNLPHGERI